MLRLSPLLFRFSQKITKNYYQTLRVHYSASEKDIKQAYKTLAKQYHPDINTGYEEQFKNVNEAYSVLSDPQRRRQYDRQNRHIFRNYEHRADSRVKNQTKKQSSQEEDLPYKEETLEELREMQRKYQQKYMKPKSTRVYQYDKMQYRDNQHVRMNHRMHAAQHMRNPSQVYSEPKKTSEYNQRYDRSKDSLMTFMTESARALRDVWRDLRKRK